MNAMPTKQEMLLALPLDFLLSFAFEAKLLRRIWTNYTKKDLVHTLIRALPEEHCRMLKSEHDRTGCYYKTLQQILFARPTADKMRNIFIRKVLQAWNGSNGVIVQELRLRGTRVDIAQFNGFSSAYEIKSARDKFTRLRQQVSLYSKVFEYINIVCDGQLTEDVPRYVGVIQLTRTGEELVFKERRRPRINQAIDPVEQLILLRRNELEELVKRALGSRDQLSRSSMIQLLLENFSPAEVNARYKSMMIKRFTHLQTQGSSKYGPVSNLDQVERSPNFGQFANDPLFRFTAFG